MIPDLASLKLSPDFQKELSLLKLRRLLAFPSSPSPLLLVHNHSFYYPAGAFLIVEDKTQTILKGHDADITALDYSPEAKLIATGQASSQNSKDYQSPVIVWQSQSLKSKKILFGLKQGVKGLKFNKSGQLLVACSNKNLLIIWQTQSFSTKHQRIYEFNLQLLSFGTSVIFSVGSSLHQLAIKFPTMPQPTNFTLPSSGMPRSFTCAIENVEGSLLVGSSSGQIIQFQKQIFKNLFIVGKGRVHSMAYFKAALYVSVGQQLTKLSFKGSKLIDEQRVLLGPLSKLCLGDKIYAQGQGVLLSIEYQSLQTRVLISSFKGGVRSIDFRKGICAAIDPFQGSIIDFKKLQSVTRLTSKTLKPVQTSSLVVSQDGAVLVGWKDGFIRAYQLAHKPELTPSWEIANAHKNQVSALFCSSTYILSGGGDSVVRIWGRSNRQMLNQISAHQKRVTAVLPDIADSSIIHSCSQDKSIHSFSLKKDKKEGYHQEKNGVVLSMCQIRSGELVTVGFNTGLSLWNNKDFYAVAHTQVPIKLSIVASSPDSKLLAVGNEFGQIWMFQTGKLSFMGKAVGHSGEVTGLRWVSDRELISSGSDGTVAGWQLKS